MRGLRGSFAYLTFIVGSILISTNSFSQSTDERVAMEMAQWVNEYASTSLFYALNKNSDPVFQNDEKILHSVNADKFNGVIPLDSSIWVYVPFKRGGLGMWVQTRSINLGLTPEGKNLTSLEELYLSKMLNLIRDQKPEELGIIFVEELHGMNVWFNLSEEERAKVAFAAFPRSEKPQFHSPEYVQFIEFITLKPYFNVVKYETYLNYKFLFLKKLYYWMNNKKRRFTVEELTAEHSGSPSVLVLMNQPGFRNIGLIEALPSASSIESAGYKKIVLGYQTFSESPLNHLKIREFRPTLQQLEECVDYVKILSNQGVAIPSIVNSAQLRGREDIIDIVESNTAICCPAVKRLAKKLKTYEKGGIPVEIIPIYKFSGPRM